MTEAKRRVKRGRALVAGTALALISGVAAANAAEYVVTISGDEGATFGGTCLLVSAHEPASYKASGTVPLQLAFAGDLISCAIQKKTGTGHLRIVIKNTAGHVVADSSQEQPFGVVLAAGR